MEIAQFNPFVRYIDKRRNIPDYTDFVVAYDHRFIYAVRGQAKIILEDSVFTLKENEALILPPATPYKLCMSFDFIFYIVNFDFLYENITSEPVTAPNKASFDKNKLFCDASFDYLPLLLRCESDADYTTEKIYDLYIKKPTLYRETISAEFKLLIIKSIICTEYDKTPELIKNILAYINKHYKENISVKDTANAFSYHPNYINRIFKQHIGKTIKSYITDLKLADAKKLLKTTTLSINEISELCGFVSYSYFIKTFREHFGISPLQYKKQNESLM